MVAVRDKIASLPPMVDYDYPADVLYVSLGHPQASEGEDHPRGIVLRFAVKDNFPSGVTVVGFRSNKWNRDLINLSRLIGAHLGIDPAGVMSAIAGAVKDRSL